MPRARRLGTLTPARSTLSLSLSRPPAPAPTPTPPFHPSGFPPALVRLKEELAAHHPALPHENPGSRWPKTSLAALKDGARLTPAQLDTLNALCAAESALFAYEGDRASIEVGHASIVLFECRSLERALSVRDVAFDGTAPVDPSPPAPEEHARVANILAESTAPDYWFAASRDGNREGHYRGGHLGATLVFRHRMRDGGGGGGSAHVSGAGWEGGGGSGGPSGLARLQRVIDDFQAKVEAALPGMYAWFAPESRHVTLRGILG